MNTDTAASEATRFELMGASSAGRVARGLLGAGMIAVGLAVLPKPAGLAVATLGIVPIAAGAFNLCPIAPLWGGHLFRLAVLQPEALRLGAVGNRGDNQKRRV